MIEALTVKNTASVSINTFKDDFNGVYFLNL